MPNNAALIVCNHLRMWRYSKSLGHLHLAYILKVMRGGGSVPGLSFAWIRKAMLKNAGRAINPHWLRPSKTLAIRFCLVLQFFVNSVVAQSRQPESTSVDSYIRGQMQDLHIPGLSIAVIRDG